MMRTATRAVHPVWWLAEAGAVVAVEILVEGEVLGPGGVVLQPFDAAVARPGPVGASEEQPDKPVGEVVGDLGQAASVTRAGRELHRERGAKTVVEAP